MLAFALEIAHPSFPLRGEGADFQDLPYGDEGLLPLPLEEQLPAFLVDSLPAGSPTENAPIQEGQD
jgi:hypothetical protein